MNIHEYQGKEVFRRFGVPTPRGFPAFTVDEAVKAAKDLGGSVWVVKAQIHAGGRGKGGGVKVAKSIDEVRTLAQKMLGMTLVTKQTGPAGRVVKRLLIEEGADIKKELYVALVVDRALQKVVLMASSEGGMDIEEVAHKTPEKIHRVAIDPVAGLSDKDADDVATKIGLANGQIPQARDIFRALYQVFDQCDASLVEVNPLIVTGAGKVVALDAKINFDSNALYRHPDIVAIARPAPFTRQPMSPSSEMYERSYFDASISAGSSSSRSRMATMSGWRNSALSSKLSFESSAITLSWFVRISGLISASEASVSSKHL